MEDVMVFEAFLVVDSLSMGRVWGMKTCGLEDRRRQRLYVFGKTLLVVVECNVC